ncbi:recombinase family protein [Streptomyces coffeae]|uniref:Recombinase family protein n=1 Tax=Streptomyces coffeae TaxID=621382 RepID=A0ABS1N8C5_9ACTN|nr:recombinase family protein [Streptomyces coffeae]MBL1096195.1 recombinase family protein [Streptomyces coffeae]
MKTTEPEGPYSAAELPHSYAIAEAARTAEDVPRAATYGRQSQKKEADSQGSPQAQRNATHALCIARGYTHDPETDHFEDIGKSGYDPSARRPGYDALMEAVRAGKYDVVVITMLSRLTRQGALEAMKIEAEMRAHGVTLVSVHEPYLDTSTPVGIGIFAIIAGLAQQESENKSVFITGAKEEHRKVGGHVSGGTPYGFEATRIVRDGFKITRLVPHTEEREHVEFMVKSAMAGKSAHWIARDLNDRGVPTKLTNMGDKAANRLAASKKATLNEKKKDKPPRWTALAVLRVLRDPRLAGFAMEWIGRKAPNKKTGEKGSIGKRVPLRGEDGAPIVAHEGIISAETWYELQDVVNGRKMTHSNKRGTDSLLGGWGILRCDVCGEGMFQSRTHGVYQCYVRAAAPKGHGGLNIRMAAADDAVARRVWGKLQALSSDPEELDEEETALLREVARRFAHQRDTSGLQQERAATESALAYTRESLRTVYKDRREGAYRGTVGEEMFHDSRRRLEEQEARCEARLAELDKETERATTLPLSDWLGDSDGDPLGEGAPWAVWDMMERRAFLALFVDRVHITPAVGRGRHAKPEKRVRIDWARKPKKEEEVK